MREFALVTADLFSALAVVFLLLLQVVTPLVHQEVLTYINTDRESDQDQDRERGDRESAVVELVYVEAGETIYRLKPSSGKAERWRSFKEFRNALRAESPDRIKLRVDRRVPAGAYQDVLAAAAEYGIDAWQSNLVR